MAVDEFYPVDAAHLVNPSRTFYPQKIEINHWQLRHFISSPEPDHLYYVAERSEVYRLNTSTKVRTHLTNLPYEVTPARCTAAGYGWICVGGGDKDGKDGQVAIIKVDEGGSSLGADVDALLPLDLGSRSIGRPGLGMSPRVSVKVETLGEDIVNSISIHKIKNEDDEEEVVAVLSNNDSKVRIYSLTHGVESAVFNMRFQMNHATISPDGQFLVAVGDFQQAYFYQRVKPKKSSIKSPAAYQEFGDSWEVFHIASLHCPPGAKISAYFTTAWSPSGALCAVGSESGYITIFDMELLQSTDAEDDAIVQIVSSSRPDDGPGPGSIRTMCFAPKPWDLLIWAEDQGRVCVADVRAGLRVRQVLNLDPDENGLLKIEVCDSYEAELHAEQRELHREAEFIQRYRRALNFHSGSGIPITTDYLESAVERRRSQREAEISALDDELPGLTAQETQILEALRTTRQRAEERENGSRPRSINYTSAPSTNNGHDIRRSTQTPANDFPTMSRERRGSSSSLRDLWRDRDLDRQPFQPRRQASVVLNEPSSSRSNTLTSSSNAASNSTPNDPWATIEAVMSRSPRPIEIPTLSRSRLASTLDQDLPSFPEAFANTPDLQRLRRMSRARERAINLRESQIPAASWGEADMLRRSGIRPYIRPYNTDPDCGPRTAGLAMSHDGRKLWAGTELGIFEFEVNVRMRLLFPALEPR